MIATAFLTRNLALELPPRLCNDSIALLLDEVGLVDHPVICKSVLLGADCPVTDAFREVLSVTEDFGFRDLGKVGVGVGPTRVRAFSRKYTLAAYNSVKGMGRAERL